MDGKLAPGTITAFYCGSAPDHCGRSLREIQNWNFENLEETHDFIQWLFPLPEPSPVNPAAPTLDGATIAEFERRPELQTALLQSFRVMLTFYGFVLSGDAPPKILPGPNFQQRSRNWLHPNNHNHLRITRIIRSLRLLGLGEQARAFWDVLQKVCAEKPSAITKTTYQFWQHAAENQG